MLDLPSFRTAVTDWATRTSQEHFAFGSGRKSRLAVAPIYADHAAWFRAEELRAWDDRWSASEEPDAHVFRRGLQWAGEGYLATAGLDLTTHLAEAEAALTVEWNGSGLPVYQAQTLLATELDPQRRRDLYERCASALATLDPQREARLRVRHEAARTAGYRSYRALHERMLGLNFGGIAARLRTLLRDTDAPYASQLHRFLRTHARTTLDDAHRCDAAFLMAFTVPGYDFPAAGLTAAVDRTLINLGLAPLAELPITLDLEPRPTKHPRAFCSGIDIPHDVRLCHAPVGGIEDYVATFHEMGHALHFAHTHEALPPEDRYIGDRALTETFAFFMQAFVTDPLWLTEVLGVADPQPLVDHARLTKLYMLRRYVAKLDYEIRLHALPADADLDDARAYYADRLTAATRLLSDGRPALRDLDDGFYCADYLRAWCVDAQIRARMRDQFGSRWFFDPAVGALLRAWWAEGFRWSADDLGAAAGVGLIRPDALIAELCGAARAA